jgi:hypothetical protein
MPQRGLAWQLGSQTVRTNFVSAIECFGFEKGSGEMGTASPTAERLV